MLLVILVGRVANDDNGQEVVAAYDDSGANETYSNVLLPEVEEEQENESLYAYTQQTLLGASFPVRDSWEFAPSESSATITMGNGTVITVAYIETAISETMASVVFQTSLDGFNPQSLIV